VAAANQMSGTGLVWVIATGCGMAAMIAVATLILVFVLRKPGRGTNRRPSKGSSRSTNSGKRGHVPRDGNRGRR
jgi:hypothetical protein